MNKYVTVCDKRYPVVDAADQASWDSVTTPVNPKCRVDAAYLASVIADFDKARTAFAFIRHRRTRDRPPLVELCRPRPQNAKPKRPHRKPVHD